MQFHQEKPQIVVSSLWTKELSIKKIGAAIAAPWGETLWWCNSFTVPTCIDHIFRSAFHTLTPLSRQQEFLQGFELGDWSCFMNLFLEKFKNFIWHNSCHLVRVNSFHRGSRTTGLNIHSFSYFLLAWPWMNHVNPSVFVFFSLV